mmetsp:Transcript_27717/g.61097  ORF Transcript_27717/g.61097 Transcript_27717/m.61097 type:complete len:208 (-) Transcript_27717:1244-1867(-)
MLEHHLRDWRLLVEQPPFQHDHCGLCGAAGLEDRVPSRVVRDEDDLAERLHGDDFEVRPDAEERVAHEMRRAKLNVQPLPEVCAHHLEHRDVVLREWLLLAKPARHMATDCCGQPPGDLLLFQEAQQDGHVASGLLPDHHVLHRLGRQNGDDRSSKEQAVDEQEDAEHALQDVVGHDVDGGQRHLGGHPVQGGCVLERYGRLLECVG